MTTKYEVLITAGEIQQRVAELAAQIASDYRDKDLLLVCVLKGAVVFLADLLRALPLRAAIDFIAVSSYGASTVSSGIVRILKDLEASIEDRDVLIVEDIIDTGLTLNYLRENLLARQPRSLRIVTLLDKPERREIDIQPDYCGFRIPDRFVVGYGLDYNEQHRGFADVRVLLAP